MSEHYATIVVEHDEQLEGRARYNRVFFPKSIVSKRSRFQGYTLLMLYAEKCERAKRQLKNRLLEDLYGNEAPNYIWTGRKPPQYIGINRNPVSAWKSNIGGNE